MTAGSEALNLALTTAAAKLAANADVRFKRRVRVSRNVRGDVVVRNRSRVVYLHPRCLENGSLVTKLQHAIRMAHEMDFERAEFASSLRDRHKPKRVTYEPKPEETASVIALKAFRQKLVTNARLAERLGVSRDALRLTARDVLG